MLHAHAFDPRQDMRRPDFELHFKRDTDLEDVELHHHDFYELYFLMSGDVTYTIESRLYHVMPGDLLLISPRELHQICIRPEMSGYERYVLWVDPQMLSRLSTEQTDLSRCFDLNRPRYSNLLKVKTEDRSLVQSLFQRLWQECETSGYGADLLRLNLLTELLVTINRLADQSGPPETDSRASSTVSAAVDYINLHYAEPLSLDLLASRFYVSKYHLSHEFNRQAGTSVYRYIQKKRLQIARQLLAQGRIPSKVYHACGFGDYPGFYRAFRTEYGLSPREYALSVRQRNQEAAGQPEGLPVADPASNPRNPAQRTD